MVGSETPRLIPVCGDADAQLIQSGTGTFLPPGTGAVVFAISYAGGSTPVLFANLTSGTLTNDPVSISASASNVVSLLGNAGATYNWYAIGDR
jgi:hypothetical protein